MELNPNHPVTRRARDHWHKIAALIMIAEGKTEIKFTDEHLRKLANDTNIVIDERGGGLSVRIVNNKEAAALALKEGGRAIDS